jgi:hypothetical protein
MIDRLAPLTGMERLRVLSLGRNCLKKLERLEDVGATLEELWVSYNQISSLDGLAGCTPRLRVLYMSNNQVRDKGGDRGRRQWQRVGAQATGTVVVVAEVLRQPAAAPPS